MKKKLLLTGLAAACVLASSSAFAGGLDVQLNLGGPGYYAPPPPQPVYVAPAPAYVAPYPAYYDPHHYHRDHRYWHDRWERDHHWH